MFKNQKLLHEHRLDKLQREKHFACLKVLITSTKNSKVQLLTILCFSEIRPIYRIKLDARLTTFVMCTLILQVYENAFLMRINAPLKNTLLEFIFSAVFLSNEF